MSSRCAALCFAHVHSCVSLDRKQACLSVCTFGMIRSVELLAPPAAAARCWLGQFACGAAHSHTASAYTALFELVHGLLPQLCVQSVGLMGCRVGCFSAWLPRCIPLHTAMVSSVAAVRAPTVDNSSVVFCYSYYCCCLCSTFACLLAGCRCPACWSGLLMHRCGVTLVVCVP
jgi:hypothetical protein